MRSSSATVREVRERLAEHNLQIGAELERLRKRSEEHSLGGEAGFRIGDEIAALVGQSRPNANAFVTFTSLRAATMARQVSFIRLTAAIPMEKATATVSTSPG